MNATKLKHAERVFLQRYPGGFNNPELAITRFRKHKPDQMLVLAQESFSKGNFAYPELIVQNMVKLVSRSSIISVFEKPKFKDLVNILSHQDREFLCGGLEQSLHGNEQTGFEMLLDLLKSHRLAKWSLITVCQAYFHPQRDVFIKPTTVKGVIEYFDLEDLDYKPTPSWAFYSSYRAAFDEMKSIVHPSLCPTNPAFSGFLWMTVRGGIPEALPS